VTNRTLKLLAVVHCTTHCNKINSDVLAGNFNFFLIRLKIQFRVMIIIRVCKNMVGLGHNSLRVPFHIKTPSFASSVRFSAVSVADPG
jgi:hypothetical protein